MQKLNRWACALTVVSGLVSATAFAEEKAAGCKMVKVAELPTDTSTGNRVLVRGSIKGEETWFLFDTGAAMTIFDNTLLSHFGIAPSGPEYRVLGVAGETRSFHVTIADLMIGNFKVAGANMSASATHFLPDNVYGLVGQDFINQFDLDIDMAHNSIGLFQFSSCRADPIYWAEKFSQADISTNSHGILVTVAVNGTPARAVLDTGASQTYVSTNLARRLGIDVNAIPPDAVQRFVGGVDQHQFTSYRYKFDSVQIGDEIVKHPNLHIGNIVPISHEFSSANRLEESNRSEFDMILGADFIRNHHIYVASRRGAMYFTWNGGSIFLPPKEEALASAPAK